MGAGSGAAIEITNHSTIPLVISSKKDKSKEGDNKTTLTIAPKESFVIFTDGLESLLWEKAK